jgi:hypothetical protein
LGTNSQVLRKLPTAGPLFPQFQKLREAHRATEFRRACRRLEITGITLHSYAIHHIDEEAYKKHLENLRAISKWILLPKLCQNKTIDESDARIGDLKKFIEIRNMLTHPKRVLIKENLNVIAKAEKEGDEFLTVVRKLEKTVLNAVGLLG